MKAISLDYPWGDYIRYGLKRYETRDWKQKYRGLIAIHCTKRWTRDQAFALQQHAQRFPEVRDVANKIPLALGHVICVCELVNIHRTEDIIDSLSPLERALGNYAPDRYAWELKLLYECRHPAIGHQKIWNWDAPQRQVQLSLQF